ncbi:UNVERIFIED_ORG: Ser/Thr protein kinase RdoA (MazF antagonist) [Herbaspirillum seropedicae]|jgi:Putative homoserine kinase type II (protein kinase fold)
MVNTGLQATITALLTQSGLDAGDLRLTALDGGGNNRVYAVDTAGGRYLAKAYFSDAADTRDRLGAEYRFLRYTGKLGLRCVPRALACDLQQRVGLYEYVHGEKIVAARLTSDHVMDAAQFLHALNAARHDGHDLPPASEACFDLTQHLTTVDRRIARLQALVPGDAVDAQAQALISEMAAVWQRHRARLVAEGLPVLLEADRCISPSDFGFHNVLLRPDGQLCFIDFEYAGWDDPAKMIGDFFCQPAVPVPFGDFEDFAGQALAWSERASSLRERSRQLLPVMQAKWCCIMLNEFLPEAARRRQFADASISVEQRKRTQLDKARQFFQSRLV